MHQVVGTLLWVGCVAPWNELLRKERPIFESRGRAVCLGAARALCLRAVSLNIIILCLNPTPPALAPFTACHFPPSSSITHPNPTELGQDSLSFWGFVSAQQRALLFSFAPLSLACLGCSLAVEELEASVVFVLI